MLLVRFQAIACCPNKERVFELVCVELAGPNYEISVTVACKVGDGAGCFAELWSCLVKVEVAVLSSPFLVVRTAVSVGVKDH